MQMSIDSLNSNIRTRERAIDDLNDEISTLKKELEKVLEAQRVTNQKENDFYNYISREQALAAKVGANDQVKLAVGFGNRMNNLLTGSKYRSAISSIDGIKKALRKKESDIEAKIAQCKRKIQTHQDAIRSLNNQISRLTR
jgi:prefoldin subunit 5